MREKGEVVSFVDGKARIKFERSDACAKCGLCRTLPAGRQGFGPIGETPLLEVETKESLFPGDKVTVEIKGPGLLRASVLVFLVPLIFFLTGTFAGRLLARRLSLEGGRVDLVGLAVGAAALSLAFILLRIYENRLRRSKSFEVKIVDIQRKD